MDKVFALLKNGVVDNTIVCNDETFLEVLESQGVCEGATRIDGCEFKPGIGWTWEALEEGAVRFTNVSENMYVVVQNNESIQFGEIEG